MKPILIAVPVFNDWESAALLLSSLDNTFQRVDVAVEVLIVDDASTVAQPSNITSLTLEAIRRVSILTLRRNLGHQQAIATALAYIEEHLQCQAVVVMDGDGEDRADDVLRLMNRCRKKKYKMIVFARRKKRSESKIFKFFYVVYKQLYMFFTGQYMDFGNFSIIPSEILKRVVVVSELWVHYAAGILKSKLPWTAVSINRSSRLAGKSKMNFVSLVTHGLSAISVSGDVLGARLLVFTSILALIACIIVPCAIVIKFFSHMAVPNWATLVIGFSLSFVGLAAVFSLFFIFLILNSRNSYHFIPSRDYRCFVLSYKICCESSKEEKGCGEV